MSAGPKSAAARAAILAGAIAGGTATAKRGREYYAEIGRMGGYAGKGVPRKRKAKKSAVVERVEAVSSNAVRSAALASLDSILDEMIA